LKRILSIFVITILGLGIGQAQQIGPNISWENPTHDFGTIQEAGGNVTYSFPFTNTGSEPLIITEVKPSCGCTSSDYTKEPVPAGGKGYVSATYNPLHRPGKFSKSITVTTNANPPTSVLRITGEVTPKPRTIEDDFPRELGELRAVTNHLALMRVKDSEIKTDSVKVANTTDHNLTITFSEIPSNITISAVPKTLKPGQQGALVVSYDAKKKNDYGFLMDKVGIVINGKDDNKTRLTISATVEEDFSKLSEKEIQNAPKIVFDNPVFNFGKIKQGEKVSYDFTFKNQGKRDLIIRKTKASCGCTIVNTTKSVVKPGETGSLQVTFNSAGKTNRQNKSITVVTNDPTQSQMDLRVMGDVEPANAQN